MALLDWLFSLLGRLFGSKTHETQPDDDATVSAPSKAPILAAGWLKLAQSEIGTSEIVGKHHNPKIIKYYADAGHGWVQDDETAWCAAAVGSWLERAGFAGSKSLAARSYLNWGKKLKKPKKGCIVVLSRGNPKGWQGHVGLYMGETANHIKVLGGNQNNEVNISSYPKSRLLGYRWPITAMNSRTNIASVIGAASAGSSALLLSLKDLLAISSEIKGLASFFPQMAIVGAVIAVLSYMVIIWARYQDLKEKGR